MTAQPLRPETGLLPAIMLLCIVIAGISSAGCTAVAGTDSLPVRIGVMLPESGSLAMHGLDELDWAVDAMNRQGGVGGRTIELVYRDTSTGNISAYAEELAGRDDIDIIIGPATSAELMLIAPLVTGRGKLLISPSATSGIITAEYEENDRLWRTCAADGQQLKAVFRILRENGVSNVSLITANSTYGETFARIAPVAAAMNGIRLTGAVSVDASDDFAEIAHG